MKLLFITLFLSFSVSACQSFKDTPFENTRVILVLNEPVISSEIKTTLKNISESIQIDSISLIRKGNDKQLIVNVLSCKNQDYWLAELNSTPLIKYAEIDAKKTAN